MAYISLIKALLFINLTSRHQALKTTADDRYKGIRMIKAYIMKVTSKANTMIN